MRMRPILSAFIGILLGAIALNGFAQSSAPAAPAASPAKPPPPKPPTPSKAPLGAPPSDDSTDAYAFRTKMSQDPPCQEISQEADRVFMDGSIEVDAKAAQLK